MNGRTQDFVVTEIELCKIYGKAKEMWKGK